MLENSSHWRIKKNLGTKGQSFYKNLKERKWFLQRIIWEYSTIDRGPTEAHMVQHLHLKDEELWNTGTNIEKIQKCGQETHVDHRCACKQYQQEEENIEPRVPAHRESNWTSIKGLWDPEMKIGKLYKRVRKNTGILEDVGNFVISVWECLKRKIGSTGRVQVLTTECILGISFNK